MLKWLVGSKPDHPLANARRVRALIAELPADDHVKALDQITRWLEWLREDEALKLGRLAEVTGLLDASAQTRQRQLVFEYLGISRQHKFQEHRRWTCGFNFAKALGESYLLCIRQHQANTSGSSAGRKQIPVLVARALRAIAMQVKWTLLRYGLCERRLWGSIGELYRYAEQSDYLTVVLQIYPDEHGTGTVSEEYLKIMMLWASGGMLPPLKQEIVERIGAQFAGAFRIGKMPFAGAMYWFDHAADNPPLRLIGNPPAGTDIHYFGPGEVHSRILEIAAVVEKTGVVPSAFIPSETCPPGIVLAVLKHLGVYWSAKRPVRASERRATSPRITVVPGYAALLDALAREESDALDFSATSAESWVAENVSANGYGALVPATAGDWLRVGELIGIQVEGDTQWGVGFVRRVVRDAQRRYRVGIEVVSRAVVPVKLFRGQDGHDAENAMLLSGEPDANAQIGVMMRAGSYDPNSPVDVAGRKNSCRLTPVRMVDAGDDFDWAVYTISGRFS